MRLKSLEIQGFKTFPDKTKLSFEQGITSVVGPNGSGKSNISDAIRWVLGEQSPKSLRCAKMEDVVFNGTDKRKRQGYAEVTLNIDNKDRALDFNGDDIAVTRRYYRSGESEYLINKAAVRLKDINELFMDTGLGRDGYSMIGQGKIDSIVSSKGEDRREIFEEAAGISRYRYRKIDAERKLKSTEDNLLRLRDIVTELEERVGPLEKQSEKAQKFLEYSEEKRGLEIALWLLTLDRSQNELKVQDEKISIAKSQYDDAETALEQIQTESEEIYIRNGEYSSKIENIRTEITDIESKISEKRSLVSVAENDILHNNENIDRIKNDIAQFDVNADELVKRIADKEKEISELDADIIAKKKKYSELSEQLNEINTTSGKSSDVLQEITAELSVLTSKSADARVTEMTAESTVSELNSRIESLISSNDEKKTQSEELADISKDYDNKIGVAKEKIESLKNTIDGLQLKLSSKEKKKDELREESNKLMLDVKEHMRKISFLENLERNLEGFSKSVKTVVNAQSHGKVHGICGPVSRVISVPKEYGVAIETALGSAMQNIVTETDEDAKRAIRYLKSVDGGRATFLPLNTITDRGSVRNDVLREKGVIGVASDLVEVDSKFNTLVKNLLGRIIVVDNIDNALAVARKNNQSLRLVTIEGELINPGGSMTGGAFRNSSNLLGRKRELDELKEQIDNLKSTASKAAALDAQLKTSRDQLRQDIDKYNSELQQAYLKKNTLTMSIEQVKEKLAESERVFVSIEKEVAELNNQITEINNNKNSLADNNKKHEAMRLEAEARVEELEGQGQENKDKLTAANARVSELMIKFNSVKQKEDFIVENIRRINMDIEKYKEELEGFTSRVESSFSEITELEDRIAAIKTDIASRTGSIADNEDKVNEFSVKREELQQSHKEFFARREELSEKIAGLEKDSYKLTSIIEKNTEKADELSNYMWEEYELTYSSAQELKDDNLPELPALKKEIVAVKAKIKSLGDVNVNAIDDYKEVSERYEFLKGQHDDIVSAETNLVNIIAELEKSMQEQFAEKFKEIQVMFDKVFKELFGGGRGALELVDTEDLLETGIRIIAQPPGKKLQNMMQLSGGEKSLTAIALLFAIQSLKPSPFCLLDEIEAALDDSNVRRFAQYLNRLTKDTQFIVISHRKGTMEAADILYGITMQEKGVSTLVSVNLIENDLDK